MATLKNDIQRALVTLHRKTKKEYIHLSEIYTEVEKIRNKPNANNGASIRNILETNRYIAGSNKPILFNLKEKGTGLWQSAEYDNLQKIENLKPGDILTKNQLLDIFKIAGQGGILKSNSTYSLVLKPSKSDISIYKNSNLENGKMIYTGQGTTGNQTLDKQNLSLLNSKNTNLPIFLFFPLDNNKYIFKGQVTLYDTPYQEYEKDKNKK